MIEKIGVLAFIVVSVAGQGSFYNSQQDDCCEDYCYVNDEEPYNYFSTKTAYDILNRRSGSQHIVSGCTPVLFWSIIRHGTRLPSAKKIEKLQNLHKLHEEIIRNYGQRKSYPDRGSLCTMDYEIFRRWRLNNTITSDMANSLTNQGKEELKLLARRYRAKYSQILQGPYNDKAHYFQYTNSDRTYDSYQAYIEGLFGAEAFRIHANTVNDEKLVNPYENCRTWTEKVKENPDIRSEYNRFLENPEYLKMVRDVFTRLGFRYTLNSTIINDIYDMCRYEKAWNIQQRSPWCIAFTKSQLKLLEYAEDLKHYYKTGYGNPMSQKIGCTPLKDFYDRFDNTVNSNFDGARAVFYFTNSDTIQSLLTAMGVAKDNTPLTADNYHQQSRRNWRTSILDPFASNLAAVLYQCINKQFKVMFFLNEIPVEFPECSVGLCDWTTVQQKYQDIVNNCNVEEFCSENIALSISANYMMLSLILALLFYVRV